MYCYIAIDIYASISTHVTIHQPNAGIMLGHSLRRWPSITPAWTDTIHALCRDSNLYNIGPDLASETRIFLLIFFHLVPPAPSPWPDVPGGDRWGWPGQGSKPPIIEMTIAWADLSGLALPCAALPVGLLHSNPGKHETLKQC